MCRGIIAAMQIPATPRAAPPNPALFIDVKALTRKLGCGITKIDEDEAAGLMTKRVKFGTKAARWFEHEADAIQAAWAAGKTPDEVRELVRQLMDMRQQRYADILAAIAPVGA